MPLYADYLTVNRDFVSVFSKEVDGERPDAWRGFIPHEKWRDIFDGLLRALERASVDDRKSVLLQGAYGVDYPYWSGNLPNRVPVESPTDNDVPSPDDRVFCLSCHRAHGSDRRSGLIWADGSTKLSTCQQCHNR